MPYDPLKPLTYKDGSLVKDGDVVGLIIPSSHQKYLIDGIIDLRSKRIRVPGGESYPLREGDIIVRVDTFSEPYA